MNKKQRLLGSIYLEALLAMVVFVMIVFAIIPLLSFILKRTAQSKYEPYASVLLQEGMEASYNVLLASSNWSAFSTDANYRLAKTSANKWQLREGTEVDIETRYTRSIIFSAVCQDDNGYLIQRADFVDGVCPGNLDPDGRIITVNITWTEAENNKVLTSDLLVLNANP